MPTYAVTMPFAGTAFLEVEADSEEEAIAKFNDAVDDLRLKPTMDAE